MNIRRFTNDGMLAFEEFLANLKAGVDTQDKEKLLMDERLTTQHEPAMSFEVIPFTDRFEVAEFLFRNLQGGGFENIEKDTGLWTWLSLFWFELLCPPDQDGKLKPKDNARYILNIEDFRKYYRHLLAGPYYVYKAHQDHPEIARVLLCNPLNIPGELAEQIASRQERVTNSSVVEAATRLYINPSTNRPKRGAAGKGPGSIRRLMEILDQYDLNWDLYSMRTDDILSMLPGEFAHFLGN